MAARGVEGRFWGKVQKSEGCWLWTGRTSKGYGVFDIREASGTRESRAHRLAYEWLRGPIPMGLVLDHLCRNRACVNPDHLEPVTVGENTLRGMGFAAVNAARAMCVNGHPFSAANTYVPPGTNFRYCRECKRKARRESARRVRARNQARWAS